MVVQGDSETEAAHFLFVIVKNNKFAIYAIVFGNQMQKGYSDPAQGKVLRLVVC